MRPLTPKQKAFVAEYLVDLNATQAAIRAGYKVNSARQAGAENLTKPVIQSAIQAAMAERAQRTEITQDRVLREYARIAFFDPSKLFGEDGRPLPVSEIDEDTRRAIAGLDVVTVGNNDIGVGEIQKFKIANKLGALDSIGKHLGMFIERQDVNVKATVEEIRRTIVRPNGNP